MFISTVYIYIFFLLSSLFPLGVHAARQYDRKSCQHHIFCKTPSMANVFLELTVVRLTHIRHARMCAPNLGQRSIKISTKSSALLWRCKENNLNEYGMLTMLCYHLTSAVVKGPSSLSMISLQIHTVSLYSNSYIGLHFLEAFNNLSDLKGIVPCF